jgi:hypothetical protein
VSSRAHCTRHKRYVPGCIWCRTAEQDLARATGTTAEEDLEALHSAQAAIDPEVDVLAQMTEKERG